MFYFWPNFNAFILTRNRHFTEQFLIFLGFWLFLDSIQDNAELIFILFTLVSNSLIEIVRKQWKYFDSFLGFCRLFRCYFSTVRTVHWVERRNYFVFLETQLLFFLFFAYLLFTLVYAFIACANKISERQINKRKTMNDRTNRKQKKKKKIFKKNVIASHTVETKIESNNRKLINFADNFNRARSNWRNEPNDKNKLKLLQFKMRLRIFSKFPCSKNEVHEKLHTRSAWSYCANFENKIFENFVDCCPKMKVIFNRRKTKRANWNSKKMNERKMWNERDISFSFSFACLRYDTMSRTNVNAVAIRPQNHEKILFMFAGETTSIH